MLKNLCALLFWFGFLLVANAQTKNFLDQPYMEVTGEYDSLVTPNEIFIKIVITEKDSKGKVSVEEAENTMIAAFKTMGIDTERDLTMSDMLSNYKFYLLKQKDVQKSKKYILKVGDAAMSSKVFVKLEDLDISNTSIENVGHTQMKQIQDACRTKAIENAKAKAVALTKPLGQSVGNAVYINDIESAGLDRLDESEDKLMMDGYYSAKVKRAYAPPKIDFDKIRVRSAVHVKFLLK